jgi:hypothetical protein
VPCHRDAILVGSDIGIRSFLNLLQIRRKFEERGAVQVGRVFRGYRVPGNVLFEPLDLKEEKKQQQVDDDRNPCGLTAARTREIVLQLDKQMRNAMVVRLAVSCFPSLTVVKPELFRLRLFGSDRILEWNLCDGHELGLSVRHTIPSLRCIRCLADDHRMTQRVTAAKLPLFSHLSCDSAYCQMARDLRV